MVDLKVGLLASAYMVQYTYQPNTTKDYIMTGLTYTRQYLTRQMTEGLSALMRSAASIEAMVWPIQNNDNGKFICGALLNPAFFVVGFQDIGISSMEIQFDVEFQGCEGVSGQKEGEIIYQWDGDKYEMFSSISVVGLRLYDINSQIIDEDGEDDFFRTHFIIDNYDEEDIAELVLADAFSQLNECEKMRFLRSVLAGYNRTTERYRLKIEAKDVMARKIECIIKSN